MSANLLRRFLVYRSAKSRQHLCVCAARDGRHAVRIARQMFLLERTAFAVPEAPRSQPISKPPREKQNAKSAR